MSNPTATNTILLNGLVQGDTDITRDGDLVNWTSLQVKGKIDMDSDNVLSATARIIIFMDRFAKGAAPTAAELLDASVITSLIFAPYNDDQFPRFKILWDQMFSLNGQVVAGFTPGTGATTSVAPVSHSFNFRRKINPNKKNQSNYGLANGGIIADISTNSIYVLLLSENTTASAISPTVTLGTRLYFKDL